ncbi:MAG: phenylphosphate carboxylase subunit delta [Desulfobacteraceae bacterium]|nr:MAG: phenylphosphate carboxylase subunit delta [Desulfobacteraceae bacterium]
MIQSKLNLIKLLLLDVDGVLTNGQIVYGNGNLETKSFNVKDGLGLRLLQSAGIKVGIVTGRTSEALSHRCMDLGITMIYAGVKAKGDLLDPILSASGFLAHEVAFVGDDLPDIPLLKKVGVSIAVADAHDLVKKTADMVTIKKGGAGAVREVCEQILEAKGLWKKIVQTCI